MGGACAPSRLRISCIARDIFFWATVKRRIEHVDRSRASLALVEPSLRLCGGRRWARGRRQERQNLLARNWRSHRRKTTRRVRVARGLNRKKLYYKIFYGLQVRVVQRNCARYCSAFTSIDFKLSKRVWRACARSAGTTCRPATMPPKRRRRQIVSTLR